MSEIKDSVPEFMIQRIYTKDISFETPHTPQIFLEEWHPELKLDFQMQAKPLEQNLYEVVLAISVTVHSKKQIAFLVELKQAGIFLLKNFSKEQMKPMLGIACPNILFPYAREAVSALVARGGFPQLFLAPVNFEALYAQQQEGALQEG